MMPLTWKETLFTCYWVGLSLSKHVVHCYVFIFTPNCITILLVFTSIVTVSLRYATFVLQYEVKIYEVCILCN